MTGESMERSESGALGFPHVFWVFWKPRSLFSRIEDTGAYGWPLAVLLICILLLGYLEVQSGLIDRVVDLQTERSLAELEKRQGHLVDRMELREQMEDIRKGGEFTKLIKRIEAMALAPIRTLAAIMLIASFLYAAVALTGRKPEYHTLMGICVYSAYVLLLGYAVRLAMVFYYETVDIDTSLKMLAAKGEPTWLVAVDPFRIAFWFLVGLGVVTTHQLSRRAGIVTCGLLFVAASGLRVAIAYLPGG